MEHTDLKPIKSGVPSKWLLSALAKRGVTISDICRTLNLKKSLFHSPEAVLPVAIYDEIFEWGAQEVEDPALGIHLAETTDPVQFGVLGYLLSNSATLKDWCELCERYYAIFAPEFGVSFRSGGEFCHCCYQEAKLPGSDTRQDIDFSMTLMVETIRHQVEPDWNPNRCTFTYSTPLDLTEHQRIFGENLHFNQAHNCFNFEEKLLAASSATADPILLQILKKQADHLLDQLSDKQDLVSHVRLLIATGLAHEELSSTLR